MRLRVFVGVVGVMVLGLMGWFGFVEKRGWLSPETLANIVSSAPQAEDFNRYFQELAHLVHTDIPYTFTETTPYKQAEVNANFDALVRAIRKSKR